MVFRVAYHTQTMGIVTGFTDCMTTLLWQVQYRFIYRVVQEYAERNDVYQNTSFSGRWWHVRWPACFITCCYFRLLTTRPMTLVSLPDATSGCWRHVKWPACFITCSYFRLLTTRHMTCLFHYLLLILTAPVTTWTWLESPIRYLQMVARLQLRYQE